MIAKALLRSAVTLTITCVVGTSLGWALLVLGFQLGLLGNIDILFYRGLCIIGLAIPLVFAILGFILTRWMPVQAALRDALSAAIVSAALNVSFLIVVPVTVDRSISIFILGQMSQHPEEATTEAMMSALFTRVYVGEDRQIARRLHEQAVSGNLAAGPGGEYRLTARGRAVVAVSHAIAAMFDSHAGILEPKAPAPPPRH